MEQHAVPQDITGFKFKLVGDMTLKQFGELAFGAIMAYLFFASPLHPFLKWPFVIFFIFLGIGLAFVPIQERPLDIWIINFFKAIYKPTYFTWRKGAQQTIEKPPEVRTGFTPLPTHNAEVLPLMAAQNAGPLPKAPNGAVATPPTQQSTNPQPATPPPPPIQADLPPIPPTPPSPLPPIKPIEALEPPKNEPVAANSFTQPSGIVPPPEPTPPPAAQTTVPTAASGAISVDQLLSQREQTVAANPPTPPTPAMTIEDLMQQREHISTTTSQKAETDLTLKEAKLNELTDKNMELMKKVDELRNQIYSISNSGGDASKLQPELERIMAEKSEVLKNVGEAREELVKQKVEPLSTPEYKEPAKVFSPPKPKPQPLGPSSFLLTNQPNVVNGLVMDGEGKPIEGVIITVKDTQGNSIRALRTSRMGQFIASTPLASGEYYMELEKQGRAFDVWRVILDGSVITPIEIRAKTEEVPVAAATV